MKTMKKIFAIVLAMSVFMAYSFTAFADTPGNDGTLTVDNSKTGTTYSLYKIFELTYTTPTTGDKKVSYQFEGASDSDLYKAATASDSPFTVTSAGTNKWNVSLADGKDAADVSAWAVAHQDAFTKIGDKTGNDGAIKWTGLTYGYYYVTTGTDTVVSIDSTLKDVTVIDKNRTPSWDNDPDPEDPDSTGLGKAITGINSTTYDKGKAENSASYGDTVHFSIGVNAVSYAPAPGSTTDPKIVTGYYIFDTLEAGFNAPTNFKVTVDGTEIAETTDYTLTKDGNSFVITVPFAKKYGTDAVIKVTYDAVVNNAATIGTDDPNLNTANFTYAVDSGYNPDDPTDTPDNPPTTPPTPNPDNEKKTETYVYAIGLEKLDENNAKIGGATFTAQFPVKATSTTGVYEYDPNGTAGAVEMSTTSTGELVIKGLAEGTYKLNEKTAPSGYNVDPSDIEFTVAKSADTSTLLSTQVVGKTFVNQPGKELPATGGIGTTIFYILGALLVVGAGSLLITRRKVNAK